MFEVHQQGVDGKWRIIGAKLSWTLEDAKRFMEDAIYNDPEDIFRIVRNGVILWSE